jgi:hypothetical protein
MQASKVGRFIEGHVGKATCSPADAVLPYELSWIAILVFRFSRRMWVWWDIQSITR